VIPRTILTRGSGEHLFTGLDITEAMPRQGQRELDTLGENLPIESRVLSVVNGYIATRDKRVYSESHSRQEAIEEIRRKSGTHFNPEVVEVFCQVMEDNPHFIQEQQDITTTPP